MSLVQRIIGDRLDIGGDRWGLDDAESVLTLRAAISNGDFEDYWRYHLEREHPRLYPAPGRDNTRSLPDRVAHSRQAAPIPIPASAGRSQHGSVAFRYLPAGTGEG